MNNSKIHIKNQNSENKKQKSSSGFSSKQKWCVGIGIAALVGLVVYVIITKNKSKNIYETTKN